MDAHPPPEEAVPPCLDTRESPRDKRPRPSPASSKHGSEASMSPPEEYAWVSWPRETRGHIAFQGGLRGIDTRGGNFYIHLVVLAREINPGQPGCQGADSHEAHLSA